MFSHNRNVAIMGGNFNNVSMNGLQPSAFQKLLDISAPNALYNSEARFDPPKCHPKTRTVILEYLMGWIFGRNDPEALIMWLYGPAGAGKSAILQTIAEWIAERNSLLASFFFGRSDPTRNRIKPLIPTIACQITDTIPELKPYVEGAIDRDSFLLNKSLATQFQHLIITPLQALILSGSLKPGSPRLIIIDGLDECEDPKMQSMILRAIADALRSQNFPLIFLIASRPERNIHHTFSSTPLSGLWRSVVLDYTYKPNDDIRLFLMDSFREIRTTHLNKFIIPETWPSKFDVDTLIRKSSGQFIYASQVVKYISDPNDSPSRRLDIITGLRSARRDLPFAELDALYIHLLDGCSHDLDMVLSILGLCFINITNVLNLEGLLDIEHSDLYIRLAPLTSIVRVETHSIFLLHASFREFLTDPSRAPPNLYIDLLAVKKRGLSLLLSWAQMHSTSVRTNNRYLDTFFLNRCLRLMLEDLPLTENVVGLLMDVSLLDLRMFMVNSWTGKVGFPDIYSFLDALETNNNCSRPANELELLEKIYNFHKSSFEPTLRSELSKYLKNTELMTMVILLALDRHPYSVSPALKWSSEICSADMQLLGLTKYHSFSSFLILSHYRELVPVFNPSDYFLTALRIVAFLCAKRPHPTRYYEPSQMSKSTRAVRIQSAIPRPQPIQKLGRKPYILTSYASYPTRRRSVPYPRFRRQEKRCHGVCLTPDEMAHISESERYEYKKAHQVAINLLPEILEKCSKSEELITFIRTHGKKIIFFPKTTHEAIRAMHAYLDRVTQDVEMVDFEHPTL